MSPDQLDKSETAWQAHKLETMSYSFPKIYLVEMDVLISRAQQTANCHTAISERASERGRKKEG